MRTKRILKGLAIVLLIGCAIFLGIDIFKSLKINADFMKMQSPDRISSSSNVPEVRYEPTEYIITNKEDALEEIKKITLELKNEYMNSEKEEALFEVGNIHKLKNLFYDYQSYAVVKYKLLNIVDDLPKLYKATVGYTDSQLENYFDKNNMHIENYYGITESSDFIKFAKSLNFLNSEKISSATIQPSTISFDYDNDKLNFYITIKTENENVETYFIKVDYYKSSINQIKPYVEISN